MKKNTEKTRVQKNVKLKTREFKIGQRVLLKVPQRKDGRKKFHLRFKGIFRISQVIDKVNLEIRKLGSNTSQIVHIDRVVHYEDKLRNQIEEWGKEFEDNFNTTENESGTQETSENEWEDELN